MAVALWGLHRGGFLDIATLGGAAFIAEIPISLTLTALVVVLIRSSRAPSGTGRSANQGRIALAVILGVAAVCALSIGALVVASGAPGITALLALVGWTAGLCGGLHYLKPGVPRERRRAGTRARAAHHEDRRRAVDGQDLMRQQ
jgi:hypothetical protein